MSCALHGWCRTPHAPCQTRHPAGARPRQHTRLGHYGLMSRALHGRCRTPHTRTLSDTPHCSDTNKPKRQGSRNAAIRECTSCVNALHGCCCQWSIYVIRQSGRPMPHWHTAKDSVKQQQPICQSLISGPSRTCESSMVSQAGAPLTINQSISYTFFPTHSSHKSRHSSKPSAKS
jgi:hypothetical protein